MDLYTQYLVVPAPTRADGPNASCNPGNLVSFALFALDNARAAKVGENLLRRFFERFHARVHYQLRFSGSS